MWKHDDKPGEKVTDNADKDSDWPRLIHKGSHAELIQVRPTDPV